MSIAASRPRQSRPAVSPDGTRVAFLQVQRGAGGTEVTQLCVWSLASGETTILTSFPRGTGPVGPAWSPDGQYLAVDASHAPRRDPDLPYRVTRPIWRMDNMGLVEDKLTGVFVVPASGGPPQRLTSEGGVISFLQWSPDGKAILYGSFGAAGPADYEIKIVEHPAGNTRTVTTAPFLAYTAVAAWLPDGRVAYNSPWQINRLIDLLVFDPSTGTRESRLPDSDGQLFGLVQAGFDARVIEPPTFGSGSRAPRRSSSGCTATWAPRQQAFILSAPGRRTGTRAETRAQEDQREPAAAAAATAGFRAGDESRR